MEEVSQGLIRSNDYQKKFIKTTSFILKNLDLLQGFVSLSPIAKIEPLMTKVTNILGFLIRDCDKSFVTVPHFLIILTIFD